MTVNIHKLLGAVQISMAIFAAGVATMDPLIAFYTLLISQCMGGALQFYYGTTQ